ncbi:hypothetical protein X915_gp209 [Bacillus phage vB_BanS-Tsamsa]|uniref:Uncharacterized protein n=1 Tax=Bacillus phage vB_BanS-Tsamsa TaxID=1308863 RepID=U5JA55_9CAUD|nr:hypothetical protein X915_gp209 [Bacillus phage vB_BanS-Tsamsa]AGI11814.1 hypothetical protein [Bacillus phage vB_BanS-Tsamsa]
MNISQEKAYIQNKMKNILDEQARLIDLHSGLRESLNNLTEMESRGITEVTLSEYVAFAKSALNEEVKVEQQKMKLEEKPKTKYPINQNIRNHMGIRQPIVTEAIVEVLKANKTPMHLNELFKKTNERLGGQITSLKNFQNNNLQRAMKVTNEIKRTKTKGYYQYNGK